MLQVFFLKLILFIQNRNQVSDNPNVVEIKKEITLAIKVFYDTFFKKTLGMLSESGYCVQFFEILAPVIFLWNFGGQYITGRVCWNCSSLNQIGHGSLN